MTDFPIRTNPMPAVYSPGDDRGNTSLFVTDGNGSNWYAMRRLHIPDVRSGDVFHIDMRGQIRNDAGFNTEMAELLTVDPVGLNAAYTDTTPEQYGILTSAQPISGYDVDPTIHYGRFTESTSYVSPADYPFLDFTMWIRLRSTGANGTQFFTNQPTQAFMKIEHWKR